MDSRPAPTPPLRLLERPARDTPPARQPAPAAWWQRWLGLAAPRHR